jgi:septal ring factor EnvC (AmiA/AmiB activator)
MSNPLNKRYQTRSKTSEDEAREAYRQKVLEESIAKAEAIAEARAEAERRKEKERKDLLEKMYNNKNITSEDRTKFREMFKIRK